MQISTLAGEIITLDVEPTKTIENMKSKVQEHAAEVVAVIAAIDVHRQR